MNIIHGPIAPEMVCRCGKVITWAKLASNLPRRWEHPETISGLCEDGLPAKPVRKFVHKYRYQQLQVGPK